MSEQQPTSASQDAVERKAIVTSRDLRRRRARRLAIGAAIWVGIPTLLAAIYYGAIATPRFESVALLTVESSEAAAVATDRPDGFLPHAGSSRDLQVAREYVRSRAMLEVLLRDHGFVAHYADPSIDRWSRLPAGASKEVIYDYFRDHVQLSSDASAGTLTLRIEAFTAAKAAELGRAIIATAETMMNELSSRAMRDQLALAESGVEAARGRMLALAAPTTATDDPVRVAERDLALRSLTSALTGLEQIRALGARQRRYLIAVAEPSLADSATQPRRLWSVATVFVTALALAGVLSLLVASVREHAKF